MASVTNIPIHPKKTWKSYSTGYPGIRDLPIWRGVGVRYDKYPGPMIDNPNTAFNPKRKGPNHYGKGQKLQK